MMRVTEKTRREARFGLTVGALTSLLGLPAGARIEGIWLSGRYGDAFEVRVSHPEFKPITEGQYVPEINALIVQGDDGRLSISWDFGEGAPAGD